jgi:hypothetical protein
MKKNYMFTETHRDRVYVYLPSSYESFRFHANSLYYETKFNDDVYFEKKHNMNDDSIERLLFEYSVRIGGIITYILLQAMNPDTVKKLTFDEKVPGRAAKDYLVEKWVQNVISPVEMLKV